MLSEKYFQQTNQFIKTKKIVANANFFFNTSKKSGTFVSYKFKKKFILCYQVTSLSLSLLNISKVWQIALHLVFSSITGR